MGNKIKTLLVFIILLISLNYNAFAGVSSSTGTSGGSGGGGGHSSSDMYKMGKSYNSYGLRWNYNKGNVNWTSPAPFAAQYGGASLSGAANKWASVQKYSNSQNIWFNFRWQWWYQNAGLKNPINYIQNGYYGDVWKSGYGGQIADFDLENEALKNGFRYNPNKQLYEKSSNGQKLDIVWTGTTVTSQTTPGTTIVEADIDGVPLLNDISGRSAQSLYENPVTSVPYDDTSLASELNYNKTINADVMRITKTVTYYFSGFYIYSVTTYSKGAKTHMSRDIKYNVNAPDLSPQIFFKPFDLNRNGAAINSDVKLSYPGYNATLPLLMSVNNNQGITDGTKLKTLDTNSALSFNIAFNSNQFGIPSKTNGGFNIDDFAPGIPYRNNDGTYENQVIESIGSNGESLSGKLSSAPMHTIGIPGNISQEIYWNSSAKAGSSSNNGSLTYGGDEKIGGLNSYYSFLKGWTGGNFSFKTTTMGSYNLFANGRPWWEMQYEKGLFYGYGISYSGIITTSEIGDPKVDQTSLYTKLGSDIMTQPILKGNIDAKTVGGTIK